MTNNIDPTECYELMRSTRLVCINSKSNKDYQAVFGIHPKTKQIVSWIEWGRICDIADKSYKKQFKVHYVGTEVHDAVIPVERMLSKKALVWGDKAYTLENGNPAQYTDWMIKPRDLANAVNDYYQQPAITRPRKRIRAGNVLVPFFTNFCLGHSFGL